MTSIQAPADKRFRRAHVTPSRRRRLWPPNWRYVGIGAVLRSEDGYAKIVSLVPGGPADNDKRLKPDDKVEAVVSENTSPTLGESPLGFAALPK